jgi:hypothetical protein
MSELTDSEHQVLLISHNAEIIDNSPSNGYIFTRDNHSTPARVINTSEIPEGITVSEALARGWIGSGERETA